MKPFHPKTSAKDLLGSSDSSEPSGNKTGTDPNACAGKPDPLQSSPTGGLYQNLNLSTRALSWVIVIGVILMVLFMILGSRNGGYTVTYNSRGGSDVPAQTYDFQEMVVWPTPPQRQGYVFTGWYMDENCTELASGQYPVEFSREFYAGWKPYEEASDPAGPSLVSES